MFMRHAGAGALWIYAAATYTVQPVGFLVLGPSFLPRASDGGRFGILPFDDDIDD